VKRGNWQILLFQLTITAIYYRHHLNRYLAVSFDLVCSTSHDRHNLLVLWTVKQATCGLSIHM